MEWILEYWNIYSAKILTIGTRIVLIFAIIVGSKLVRRVASHTLHTAHKKYHQLDETLLPVIITISDYFIYGISIVIVLDLFGVNTTSIIAIMGAAGVAIGLALKDTLGNIASGIMLLFLRPFKVNDYVECSGIAGTVKKIDLFTTDFHTVDGIFITVPNSSIFASPIKNYTRNATRRMSLTVDISYSDSIEQGIAILYRLAHEEPRILQVKDYAPYVFLQTMGESSITLELRAWAEIDVYWSVYWDMNKKIKVGIEEAGLTIPFPQRTLIIQENKQN